MIDTIDDSDFDPRAFRRALGNFATGVTIVTAQSLDGVKVGVTASSFNTLSIDPPLILWSKMKETRSCSIFESVAHFAVNVLASDQIDMSNNFGHPQEDKFEEIEWEEGIGGAPLFSNCAGRFQCETYDKLDGGDHWIFVGKVVAFDDLGRSPLCFHQGAYSILLSHPGSTPKADRKVTTASAGGRLGNNTFYLMLKAVRAFQASYQPKQEALGLSIVEARCLIMLNDQSGLNAERLQEHVESPLQEISEALVNLSNREMITTDGDGYVLTDAGQAKVNESWNLADAHTAEAFKYFSDEQVDTFRDVLKGLIER